MVAFPSQTCKITFHAATQVFIGYCSLPDEDLCGQNTLPLHFEQCYCNVKSHYRMLFVAVGAKSLSVIG